MALFKPEVKDSSSSGDWLGYKQMGIHSVTDKTDNYEWADLYLAFEMKIEGSQYPRTMYLAGSFDKELDGTLKESSFLKRMYHVFDIIGFDGGVNAKGQFEDADGNIINNIGEILNDKLSPGPIDDPEMNLLGYIYREAPKQPNQAQIYTKIHHYIQRNTNEGMAFIKDRIEYLKKNNFIKEASPDQVNGVMGADKVQTGTPNNVEGSVVNQL